MSVFRNYNKNQAGGVNANAFPRVHPISWTPSQQNIRANPNIPSQPQRVGPYERGTWHDSSASGTGTLAPQTSTTGCSGCGCGGGAATPTASDNATGHAFQGNKGKVADRHVLPQPRVPARTTGTIRSGIQSNNRKVALSPFISGRNSGR